MRPCWRLARVVWCTLALLWASGSSVAQRVVVDVQTGSSVHAPNDLHVDQLGRPGVVLVGAEYETRPFVRPYNVESLTESYYSLRVGYESTASLAPWGALSYEIELLHDKAYLVTPDPSGAVTHYELSDGLNQLLFNVATRWTPRRPTAAWTESVHLVTRIGLGPVVVAPASIVRGLDDGTRTHRGDGAYYWLAGPGAQLAAQVRYMVTRFAGVTAEVKGTVARVTHPVAEGSAHATFVGAHATFGVTFAWP